jgi:hypothetical protein
MGKCRYLSGGRDTYQRVSRTIPFRGLTSKFASVELPDQLTMTRDLELFCQNLAFRYFIVVPANRVKPPCVCCQIERTSGLRMNSS